MAKMHRACQDNYVTQKGKIRRLTPRECARLQGFEDSFVIPVSDSQAYKQFGNAVTVNVSRAVAQSVKSTFIKRINGLQMVIILQKLVMALLMEKSKLEQVIQFRTEIKHLP